MKYFRIYIFFIIMLFSCKTETITTNNNINKSKMSKEQLFKNISSSNQLTQLKVSGKVSVDMDKPLPNVGLTLYMEKGSKIWINGSVLMINVLRAYITPTRVQAYEKAQKTFIDTDFKYFNNLLNIDFINFDNLEKLLIGKVFFPIKPEDFDFENTGNQFVLSSNKDFIATVGSTKTTYSQKLWFDNQFNLEKVIVNDKTKNTSLEISYSNRINFKGINLPQLIQIFVKDKNNKTVTLEYSNFSTDKMETPYQVPSGYTKREIK